MPRVNLLGGAYQAPSLIAGAQRSINLYPERNPPDAQAPAEFTHYPRPGLTLLQVAPAPAAGRCLYRATNGDLYAVIAQTIYYIDPDWTMHALGTLLSPASTPVYMADNGTTILVVDGSVQGYQIDMPTRVVTNVSDPNFIGADRVDYIDSFLVLNQPKTPNWYSTLSNKVAFNALDFGSKTAWPDNILTLLAVHRQVWLLGPQKGEVWYNAGASPFAFNAVPENMIEQGLAAKYSPAKIDINLYWLTQSPEGDRMAVRGNQDLAAERISTHAIEKEWKTYARVDDAVGATYLMEGHAFYKLHFPTADVTWVWDENTKLWHQRAYKDTNGVLHRERDSFNAFAYGVNLGLDWSNGSLYALDIGQHVDQITPGQLAPGNTPLVAPIECIRGVPHLVGDKFERVTYNSLIADMEVGTAPGTAGNRDHGIAVVERILLRFRAPYRDRAAIGVAALLQ